MGEETNLGIANTCSCSKSKFKLQEVVRDIKNRL